MHIFSPRLNHCHHQQEHHHCSSYLIYPSITVVMTTKARTPVYLGLAAAAAGGYYLYNAGGDPSKAKNQAKSDVSKARSKLPRGKQAEEAGERVGEEANAHIDEVLETTREKAKNSNGNVRDFAKEGIDKIEQIRHETARNLGTTVDKLDRKVEEKASEAKKGISSWFGGGGK
ncbi:hypothetical protein VTN96DRAFT_8263 [Rasamsonia emersonii]